MAILEPLKLTENPKELLSDIFSQCFKILEQLVYAHQTSYRLSAHVKTGGFPIWNVHRICRIWSHLFLAKHQECTRGCLLILQLLSIVCGTMASPESYWDIFQKKHIICTIMELFQNKCFTFTTSDTKSNRLGMDKLVLPLLFNITFS